VCEHLALIAMFDLISHVTIWSPLTSEIRARALISAPSLREWGMGAFFTGRLEVIRRTKLYDLFAAMPFIAWLLFVATQMLPPLTEQIALASFFFFKIHPSALPLSTALNILSKVCTLVFLSTLVIMFAGTTRSDWPCAGALSASCRFGRDLLNRRDSVA
jgi:hypothetical protein